MIREWWATVIAAWGEAVLDWTGLGPKRVRVGTMPKGLISLKMLDEKGHVTRRETMTTGEFTLARRTLVEARRSR